MSILIRTDMEGITGVTTYDEVHPGGPLYEASRDLLMNDLLAVIEGLGTTDVVLYDEHVEGRNVRLEQLPPGVRAIVGKPRYRPDWPGGLGPGVEAMAMVGFHSMAGTAGGTLAHSYEHDILAIEVNGRRVGEIGVEAGLAGELGIPMILYTGDSAGADEARALIPGLICGVTKQSLGETAAECLGRADTFDRLRESAAIAVEHRPEPLRLGCPVRLEIELAEAPFRETLRSMLGERMTSNRVILEYPTLAEAWAVYWQAKEAALERLAAGV